MDFRLKKTFNHIRECPERWLPAFIVVIIVSFWEILSRSGAISRFFFPPPSVITMTFFDHLRTGELPSHFGATLTRVFFSLLLGGVPALILGLVMGWSGKVRRVLDPFVAAVHPIPKIAVLPLFMVIFGIGEISRVVVISVAAFFPLLVSTMGGVRQISPIYFEVAENYGTNTARLFSRIILPGSLPTILTGVRLSANIAFLVTIAVELLTAEKGLGAVIWLAWQTMRPEYLYMGLGVTALMGILLNFFLERVTKYLVPWHQERPV